MLRTWEITIPSGHRLEADPRATLEGLREEIKRKLVEEIPALQGVKSRLAVDIELRKDKGNGQTEYRRVVLRSNQSTFLQTYEIDEELNKTFSRILERLEVFTNEGSGWVVERVEFLMLDIARYRPICGGSYIPLPKEIQVKRAVVNVKNRDDDCLRWSLRASLFPAARDTERPGKYPTDDELDFEGINAPTPIDQIERVEKKNNLALNVFGWDCRQVVVYRLSKQPGNIRRIHLLLVRKGEQYHYTWIKDFNRLLHDQSKYEGRKHFCERCLHCYTREDLLEEHKPNCRGIGRPAVRIEMPKEGENKLTFQNWHKQLPAPYVIYADFEAVVIKIPEPQQGNTQKTQHHEVCGFSYVVVRYDRQTEPLVVYLGPNAAQRFLNSMQEEERKIIEVLSKPKTMIMNFQGRQAHKAAKECHVCNKALVVDTYRDAIDRFDPNTGAYEGAAHKTCYFEARITGPTAKYKARSVCQDIGGVRHGGWPVHVSGHRPSLWPMAAREWPTLDIRSGAV